MGHLDKRVKNITALDASIQSMRRNYLQLLSEFTGSQPVECAQQHHKDLPLIRILFIPPIVF